VRVQGERGVCSHGQRSVGRGQAPLPLPCAAAKWEGPKWEGPYWEGPDWEMGIIGVSVRAARRSVGRGQAPPPLPPLGPCAAPWPCAAPCA
jgi:hypothetical protein